jgi:folate-binding protein YgfZ
MTATFLADRALLRLSGGDVRGFLQGLITNDVAGALPVWAGLLSAQGKALFEFLVWADGEDLLIDCEAGQVDGLARRLTLYRLRRKIEIVREPALGIHWSAVGDEGVPDPRLPALGRRWIGPAGEGAGADDAWRAHRLAQGVVEGVTEIGQDKTLWLETNATELHGVSFTKGCYVGQENTARMNWRQKVNRRLVVVRADVDPGEPARAYYPELGLAVRHMRIADIPGEPNAIRPDWLKSALSSDENGETAKEG